MKVQVEIYGVENAKPNLYQGMQKTVKAELQRIIIYYT